jgi:hypothetical protein
MYTFYLFGNAHWLSRLTTICLVLVMLCIIPFGRSSSALGQNSSDPKDGFQPFKDSMSTVADKRLDQMANDFLRDGYMRADGRGDALSEVFARCQRSLRAAGSLEQRLSQCWYLKEQIIWQTATGDRFAYDAWTEAQKGRINELFQRLLTDERDLGMRCPDPARNMGLRRKPNGGVNMFLTAEEAFDIYAAHVAHILYLEATSRVPWSILALPPTELEEMLWSERYHSRILPSTLATSSDPYYPAHIQPNRDFQLPYRNLFTMGVGLNCDPRVGYRFIRGETSTARRNMIGATEQETMENLTRWFADNVGHGGSPEDLTREHSLAYNYLRDRLRAEYRDFGYISYNMIIAVQGCHSASNLLHDLARSVNIPLLNIQTVDTRRFVHQGLAFRWGRPDPRILHHTDDIYANLLNSFFPIRADGSRASEREATQLYFDVLWSPPGVLEAWGFRSTHDYWLVPARDAEIRLDDAPDLGVFGGAWTNERDLNALYLEKRYRLGTWHTFMRAYCNGTFEFEIRREMSALSRPYEEFRDRAIAIAAAYGCDTMVTADREYERRRGANVLAVP